MTLKHIEFTDSEVLRELERLAGDKGDYAETDLVKTASASTVVESYEPTDDLFNDVIRLASGLRARGMNKQADELENKLFVRQSAKKKMEETKKDDGEKLLDQAHPEGDVEISPSSSGLGKVWTEQSAKKEILRIVQKAPTGKYAQSVGAEVDRAASAVEELLDANDMDADGPFLGISWQKNLERMIEESVPSLGGNLKSAVDRFIAVAQKELGSWIQQRRSEVKDSDGDVSSDIMTELGGYWQASKATQQTGGLLEEGTYGAVVVDNIIKAASDALGLVKKAGIPPIVEKTAQTTVDKIDEMLRAQNSDYTIDPYLEAGGLSGEDLLLRYSLQPQLSSLLAFAQTEGVSADLKTMIAEWQKQVLATVGKLLASGKIDLAISNPSKDSDEDADDDDVSIGKTILNAISGTATAIKHQFTTPDPNRPKYAIAFNNVKGVIYKLDAFVAGNKDDEKKADTVAQASKGAAVLRQLKYEIKRAHKAKSEYGVFLGEIKKYPGLKGFAGNANTIDRLIALTSKLSSEWDLVLTAAAKITMQKTASVDSQIAALEARKAALGQKQPPDVAEMQRIQGELNKLYAQKGKGGDDEGSGLGPKKPTKKPTKKPPVGGKPTGTPHAGYKQGSIPEMQKALHGLSDALKKLNHPKLAADADRIGKTGKSGRQIDRFWGTETDLALGAAEKLRKRVKATHVAAIKTKAQGGNTASNITALKALTEYMSPEGADKRKGKSLGTYDANGSDIEIMKHDLASLGSLLVLLEDQGVYNRFTDEGKAAVLKKKKEKPAPAAKPAAPAAKPGVPAPAKPAVPAKPASRLDELAKIAGVYSDVPGYGTVPAQPVQTGTKDLGESAGYTYDEWRGVLEHFYGLAYKRRTADEPGVKQSARDMMSSLKILAKKLDGLRESKKIAPNSQEARTVKLPVGASGGGRLFGPSGKRRKGRPGAGYGQDGKEHKLSENSMIPPIDMDLDLKTGRWMPMPEKWQLDINLRDWNTTHATDLASQHFSDVDDATGFKVTERKFMKGYKDIVPQSWDPNAQTHNVVIYSNTPRPGFTPARWTKELIQQRRVRLRPGQRWPSNPPFYYQHSTLRALLGDKYMDRMGTSSKAGGARELQKFITYLRRKMATVRKEYLQDIKGTERYERMRTLTKRFHSKWNEVLGRKHQQISTAINSGDLG